MSYGLAKEVLLERYKIQKVGHLGHVSLVDVMGDDAAHVQAARVSYGKGTKTLNDDRALIRYLVRHQHCYHPDMEVLTIDGWKRWRECKDRETFLVPDPSSRVFSQETLCVNVFDADEKMEFFENNRMSYAVTSNHRMWFKGKYESQFKIVRADGMPNWGHFDPMAGYRYIAKDTKPSPLGKLVGFALGDGCWSGTGLSFHLRKLRKKDYLRQCLTDLGITSTETASSTYSDATVFYISAKNVRETGILNYLVAGDRAIDKKLLLPENVAASMLLGVFDGLVNSDGHVNEDRGGRIEFSSISPHLAKLFETLAAMTGMDAHRVSVNGGIHSVTAYPEGRTTLEARKKYFRTEHYTGKVYCATTSTGLLMVRGGPDKFGFVCGNSSPIEMSTIKLHLKMPIYIARQWMRHRTASLNEVSLRYSEFTDEFEETTQWRLQSKDNKQGSAGFLDDGIGIISSDQEASILSTIKGFYHQLLDNGVAREMARKILPVSTYTEFYWQMNTRNLLHFLGLRLDKHAQQEIREFAEAIYRIIKDWIPLTAEAFEDYQLNACLFSRQELEILREHFALGGDTIKDLVETRPDMSKREKKEFLQLLGLA